MSERPSPEEYRQLEGITPEFEDVVKHGLADDAKEIEEQFEAMIEKNIPDQSHPEQLKKVLDDEGITAELERERELRLVLKEVTRTYHEITKLAKDKTDEISVEAVTESGHVWEIVSREWAEYKKNNLSEEQLIGALKFAYESLLDIFQRLRENS